MGKVVGLYSTVRTLHGMRLPPTVISGLGGFSELTSTQNREPLSPVFSSSISSLGPKKPELTPKLKLVWWPALGMKMRK